MKILFLKRVFFYPVGFLFRGYWVNFDPEGLKFILLASGLCSNAQHTIWILLGMIAQPTRGIWN